MEYLVTMTTQVPAGVSDEEVADMRARKGLVRTNSPSTNAWCGLWRPPLRPGEWRTIGLFHADDAAELERTLASMLLRRWRTDEVTALGPHPADPGWPGTAIDADGVEFLTTFVITLPPATTPAAVRALTFKETSGPGRSRTRSIDRPALEPAGARPHPRPLADREQHDDAGHPAVAADGRLAGDRYRAPGQTSERPGDQEAPRAHLDAVRRTTQARSEPARHDRRLATRRTSARGRRRVGPPAQQNGFRPDRGHRPCFARGVPPREHDQRRGARDRSRPACRGHRPAMGGDRIPDHGRGAAPASRRAGRPFRAATDPRGAAADHVRRVDRLRSRSDGRRPGRGPTGAGGRWRDGRAVQPRSAERHTAQRRPGVRHRHLGRHRHPGHDAGPVRRRLAGRPDILAVRVPAQSPAGPWPRTWCCAESRR